MKTRANTALTILLSTMCLVAVTQAQEEADRPVGEATGAMLRKQKTEMSTLVLPTPQEWYPGKGKLVVGNASGCRFDIELVGEAKRLTLLPVELRKRVGKVAGSVPATAATCASSSP